jgi:hypothetical protein
LSGSTRRDVGVYDDTVNMDPSDDVVDLVHSPACAAGHHADIPGELPGARSV